jgi:hypothetical protein
MVLSSKVIQGLSRLENDCAINVDGFKVESAIKSCPFGILL